VKTFLFFVCSIVAFLFCACMPKQPTIPITELPAGPILQSLEKRQQAFRGLKALASVEIRKWGKRRLLENVGIVLDGQRRLRMEAYGPLGQTLMVLLWDGTDILSRVPENDRDLEQAQVGISNFLSEGIDMREICAALSGNIPELVRPYNAVQLCSHRNDCDLEIRTSNTVRRVRFIKTTLDSVSIPQPAEDSLYKSGEFVYHARFTEMLVVSQYNIPTKIEIDNPKHKFTIVITYQDIEINPEISDETFILAD